MAKKKKMPNKPKVKVKAAKPRVAVSWLLEPKGYYDLGKPHELRIFTDEVSATQAAEKWVGKSKDRSVRLSKFDADGNRISSITYRTVSKSFLEWSDIEEE